MRTVATVILFSALLPGAAGAGVYRCEDAQGTPVFSQFPCREIPSDSQPHGVDPLPVVRMAPVTAAERRVLDELAGRLEDRRRERRQRLSRARSEALSHRSRRLSECESAKSRLADLQRLRRGGYPLRQAKALDRRESSLKEAIELNC